MEYDFRKIRFNHLASALLLKAPVCSKVYEQHISGLGRGATSYRWLEARPTDYSKKSFTLQECDAYTGYSLWAGKTWSQVDENKVTKADGSETFSPAEIREKMTAYEADMQQKFGAPKMSGSSGTSTWFSPTTLHQDNPAFRSYQLKAA